MIQHNHESTEFEEKRFPIVLILDNISGPANIGSIFRLADAFNVEKLVLCGRDYDLDSNRLKRTARSTLLNVDYEQEDQTLEACTRLSAKGYTLFALEITRDSVSIDSLDFSKVEKTALILGNERNGIDEKILKLAHKKLHITMFGKNSSMNVAQATGIALFEITKSLLPFQQK